MKNILIVAFLFSFFSVACSQQQKNMTQKKHNGIQSIEEYVKGESFTQYETATFAGGCFWCLDAAFDRIEGVEAVISGYSGGETQHPTYYEVGSGTTGHAEAIRIYYNPEKVDFKTLLEVFFVAHDPRYPNREGNDIGSQYRSAIFYHDDTQKQSIEAFIQQLKEAKVFNNIATEVKAYEEFWVAEDYHQNYYELHPENPYVQRMSRPKVERVEKVFAGKLKAQK